MFYALSWFVVLVLLALWSLTAWSVHALGAWTASSAGSVAEAAASSNVMRLPEWLAPAVPAEVVEFLSSMVSSIAPMLSNLADPGPTIISGWAWAMWTIWAIGSLLLLACGALVHTLKARWRRSGSPPTRPSAELVPS